jgi:hypothetical protein
LLLAIRILVVSVPLAVLLALIGTPRTSAVDTVGLYLGLPADDRNGTQGTGLVKLTCGWHGACDGVLEPGYYALDFVGYDGSAAGEPTYWRVLAYDSGSSVARQEGNMNRFSHTSPLDCDYIMADMWKLDGSWIGRVGHLHAYATNPYTTPFYGKNGNGYKNTRSMGYLVSDENQWPCIWNAYHVHQDSWLNLGVVYSYFLGSYPDETVCYGCGWYKNMWSDYQSAFFYYR